MKLKIMLRLVSLAMLAVAVVFLAVALTHPELGGVFYIGNMAIGSDIWRVFYAVYGITMVALLVASFFVKGKK